MSTDAGDGRAADSVAPGDVGDPRTSSNTDRRGAHAGRHATPPSRHRALRRVLISLGILGLVLAVVIGGGLWFLTSRYAGNIDRVSDVFADLDAGARPAPATPETPAAAAPVTFLLVG